MCVKEGVRSLHRRSNLGLLQGAGGGQPGRRSAPLAAARLGQPWCEGVTRLSSALMQLGAADLREQAFALAVSQAVQAHVRGLDDAGCSSSALPSAIHVVSDAPLHFLAILLDGQVRPAFPIPARSVKADVRRQVLLNTVRSDANYTDQCIVKGMNEPLT